MIDFLKRLFGGARSTPSPRGAATAAAQGQGTGKLPLPADELDAFRSWFLRQTRAAVALVPDGSHGIAAAGSRLGGPAWLAAGEPWPSDERGVPLEFIAQLDCADCRSLGDYPDAGVIQFFVGRDDLYGADFDDPSAARCLVRWCDVTRPGTLTAQPALDLVADAQFSDFSPFSDDAVRTNGIGLRAEPVVDRIDQGIMAAERRIMALYERYDIGALEAFLESDEAARPQRHHSGGYPAYTQRDVHHLAAFAGHDHVLLRLTSDDRLTWGDAGECVFLIRGEDLRRGDFSRVAYSWDCY